MLTDLAELVQKYIGCKDCYYGYDNYDQKIYYDSLSLPNMLDNMPKIIPRFDYCKLVRVVKGSLPAGTINCITLYGLKRSDTEIFITCNGNRIYQITGVRTMVLAFYGELEVCNFDGIIIAHYVNFIVSPGRYRICVKNINTVYLKYVISKYRYQFSDNEFQQMWNYVYSGKRPKDKYLIHFRPPDNRYYRYPLNINTYEKCSYNELIVADGYCVLRFTT